jgi:hypothetical protein
MQRSRSTSPESPAASWYDYRRLGSSVRAVRCWLCCATCLLYPAPSSLHSARRPVCCRRINMVRYALRSSFEKVLPPGAHKTRELTVGPEVCSCFAVSAFIPQALTIVPCLLFDWCPLLTAVERPLPRRLFRIACIRGAVRLLCGVC